MKSILVGEDDEPIARLVKFKLEKAGYRVEIRMDGEQVCEAVFGGEWDLVFLDVMMPKLTGWEVLKKIRGAPGAIARVPVVILTASGQQKHVETAQALGATEFLKKPFDPDQIVAAAKKLIGEP